MILSSVILKRSVYAVLIDISSDPYETWIHKIQKKSKHLFAFTLVIIGNH